MAFPPLKSLQLRLAVTKVDTGITNIPSHQSSIHSHLVSIYDLNQQSTRFDNPTTIDKLSDYCLSRKEPPPITRGGRPPFSRTFRTSKLAAPTTSSSARSTKASSSASIPPMTSQASKSTQFSRETPPHAPTFNNNTNNTTPSSRMSSPSCSSSLNMDNLDTSRPSTSAVPSADATEDGREANQHMGMERGYVLSPMYNLILEYNQESSGNLSTAAEVSWILQNPNLHLSHFEYRVRDGVNSYTSIALKPARLNHILRAVNKLQTFLD